MIVYKISNNLNDKTYIGQTVRPISHRWTQHLRDARKGMKYPLYRAIRKYGVENFKIEEIGKANTRFELNKMEKEYICKFNSLTSENGYNILPGGNGFKMPDWVKDKISKSMIGKKKNYKISYEERLQICKENSLKTFNTKEKKEAWAVKNGSKPFKVFKVICIRKHKRNQSGIWIKGEYVGEWLMKTECAKDLKIGSCHISDCLNGKRIQNKGYIFERIC